MICRIIVMPAFGLARSRGAHVAVKYRCLALL
jgi:hypothetical protein